MTLEKSPRKSNLRRVCGLLLGAALLLATSPAWAGTHIGKIDLVQVTGSGTRFFVRDKGLSLYAVGDFKEVLLEGFFRKSNFSIFYVPIACPGGITGTCGSVSFVSVDQSNFLCP